MRVNIGKNFQLRGGHRMSIIPDSAKPRIVKVKDKFVGLDDEIGKE